MIGSSEVSEDAMLGQCLCATGDVNNLLGFLCLMVLLNLHKKCEVVGWCEGHRA